MAEGQPGYWCEWSPCWDGCCITWSGREKTYGAVRWIRYLVEHRLRPGARAQAARHPQLRGFTFDHVLNGVVIGCRRDTKEVTAILVDDNEVEEVVLHAADPRFDDHRFLYEEEIDRREQLVSRRPRPSRAALAQVAARFGGPED